MDDKNKQYPEGHFVGMWIGIGIALFAGMGVAIGVAMDMTALMGIGPGIGVAFGAGIGSSIEAKKKREGLIRPLNDEEKRKRKVATIWGIVLLGLGVIILLSVFLIFKN
jgi:hypothetical protein